MVRRTERRPQCRPGELDDGEHRPYAKDRRQADTQTQLQGKGTESQGSGATLRLRHESAVVPGLESKEKEIADAGPEEAEAND